MAFLLPIGQGAGALAGESAITSDVPDVGGSVSGLFTYSSFIGDGFQAPFYYEDACFRTPSTEYSDSLAAMSMCLVLSAFADGSSTDYGQKSDNLKALLEQCGFDMGSFAVNEWFLKKPETDSKRHQKTPDLEMTGIEALIKSFRVRAVPEDPESG